MPGLKKRGLGPAWFRFAARRTRAIPGRSALGLKQAWKGVFDTVDSERLCSEGSGFAGPVGRRGLDAPGQAGCLNQRKVSLQLSLDSSIWGVGDRFLRFIWRGNYTENYPNPSKLL